MSDSIHAKLIEIEAALADDSLSDADRSLLYEVQQALRAFLQWHTVTHTFGRVGARPIESESKIIRH